MISTPITYRTAYVLYRRHFGGVLPGGFEWRLLISSDTLPTGWDITLTWATSRGLAGLAGRKLKAEAKEQAA